MDDYIQPYIQTVLSLTSDELANKTSKQDSFLDALARFTKDPRVLRDQLVAVLLAGRDTTAGTLSFCFFELARHPEVVRKLREEVASYLGVDAQARKPTYDDLKDMKYLNAVINETLRFYPVVPFNVRYSLKDSTLPRGGGPDGDSPVGIRKDTRILYSTMIMQRRPDLYSDDNGRPLPPKSTPETEKVPTQHHPGKWIPERWVSGWQPRPWQFIPFNGGPRICIGQQFAMLEMGYTIARIFQSFQSVYAVPRTGFDKVEAEPVMQFEVTLSPGAEFNMVFVRDGEK
jgi:cytochrome P450